MAVLKEIKCPPLSEPTYPQQSVYTELKVGEIQSPKSITSVTFYGIFWNVPVSSCYTKSGQKWIFKLGTNQADFRRSDVIKLLVTGCCPSVRGIGVVMADLAC